MSATTIWFVRHGETDWNAAMRVQGSIDIPLNATGREQAQCVARRLRDAEIAAIYCSPLSRTAQTAAPLAQILGMGVRIESAIAERRYGVFQGLTPEEIAQQHPEGYARWQRRETGFAPPGGESMLAFRQRVLDGMTDIASAHPAQSVAVFSHGGVADMVYRLAHRIDLSQQRQWQVPNAGIHQLHVHFDEIRVLAWGLVDHLVSDVVHDELRGIA